MTASLTVAKILFVFCCASAQRLRFQADGEVQIKGEEGILLTADGKFDEAMFDRVFGEYMSVTL